MVVDKFRGNSSDVLCDNYMNIANFGTRGCMKNEEYQKSMDDWAIINCFDNQ